MAQRAPVPQDTTQFVPRPPASIQETGLSLGFLADLAVKTMYFEGSISGYELAKRLRLPYPGVVERILESMRREKLCEVKGAGDSRSPPTSTSSPRKDVQWPARRLTAASTSVPPL